MELSICEAHAKCFFSFLELASAIENPVRDFRDQTPAILEMIAEDFDRYKLWAGNVGATYSSKRYQDSLDYHHEGSFYQAQALKLLETLNKTIQKVLSLIQGARKPFEECSPLDSESHRNQRASSDDGSDEQLEADDSPWEISSISDDEDDDGNDDESNDTNHPKAAEASDTSPGAQLTTANSQEYGQFTLLVQKPNKEMPQLLESIGFAISCLYQLPLRRVASPDQFGPKKLSIDAHRHQSSDLRYVKEIFPQLAPNVAIRIGKMISRHRLLMDNPHPSNDTDSLEFPYPHAEFEQLFTLQVSEADTARSKHTIPDFQPYVCTFEDCGLSDQIFGSCDEWYKHESQRHRLEWFCNVEGHPPYVEQSEFLVHLKIDHDWTLNASQLSLLANTFQRPTQSSDGTCNLCLSYASGLKSHVSRHFRKIAHFTLSGAKETASLAMVKPSSIEERSSPTDFHGLRLEKPNIDGSAEETDDEETFVYDPNYPSRGLATTIQLSEAKKRQRNLHQEPILDLASVLPLILPVDSQHVAGYSTGESTDPNSQGGKYGLALQAASAHKLEWSVKVLLRLGADTDVQRGKYGDALQAASAKGHEHIVEILLKHGANVNTRNRKYDSALKAASANNHEKIVEILLKHGANVNARGGVDSSLKAASASGHEKIVEILLKHGANVNARGGVDSSLKAASASGHEKIVEILLKHGADVNPPFEFDSSLKAASASGHEKIVKILLKHGANVNTRHRNYDSALKAASANNHEKIVKILLKHGADVNPPFEFDSSLKAASASGHEKIVEILLKHGADVNPPFEFDSALKAASANNHEKIVKILLKHGANVNARGGKYDSALQAASAKGHEHIVEILLKHGANVNARGGKYDSALQAASAYHHEKIVKILLKHGANVNARGGKYDSALQAASANNHEKIVEILLKHGANVNARGGKYDSALQAASAKDHEHIVKILLNHGVNVNAHDGMYGSALQTASANDHEKIVKILLNHGANVNARDGMYDSALQTASAKGHEHIVKMLLKHGVNVDFGSALEAASANNHEKIVKILLKHGANVNARGEKYGSALQAASAKGHEHIVEILLKHGANVNARDGKYDSALQAASAKGHEKIVEILLKHGANVNARGGKYGSALQAASAYHHEKIVEILLNHGANVNAHGGMYDSALQAASAKGHERIVEKQERRIGSSGGDRGGGMKGVGKGGKKWWRGEDMDLIAWRGPNRDIRARFNLAPLPYGASLVRGTDMREERK